MVVFLLTYPTIENSITIGKSHQNSLLTMRPRHPSHPSKSGCIGCYLWSGHGGKKPASVLPQLVASAGRNSNGIVASIQWTTSMGSAGNTTNDFDQSSRFILCGQAFQELAQSLPTVAAEPSFPYLRGGVQPLLMFGTFWHLAIWDACCMPPEDGQEDSVSKLSTIVISRVATAADSKFHQ